MRHSLVRSLPLLPARHWNTRAMLLTLFAACFAMLTLARTHPLAMAQLRSTLSNGAGMAMSVISRPAASLQSTGDWLREMTSLRAENLRLRAEVARLSSLQAAASELRAENDALRGLIRAVPAGKVDYIATRIVAETSSAYMRSALIAGGAEDGIGTNQAVLNESGLVGRVVEASRGSARVLLLTDINSRVPVVSELSRERSILSGNNSPTLSMEYAPSGSKLEAGERLLTSGDGGVFPPGIPVGVVLKAEDGAVTVAPLVDLSRLEYVSVADYSL